MRILTPSGATRAEIVAEHASLPDARPADRALVRLNMISSVDGGSALGGLSGGLGDAADHEVFAALRARADAVLVGMSTAASEHYHPTTVPDQQMYVVASRPDISANPELFATGRATLLLPEGAGPAPAGVPTWRVGRGNRVDLGEVVAALAGKVVMMEGGPTLAGLMVAGGLVDEFFVTIASHVIAGDSARVLHGADADPAPWNLVHGFEDEHGFLFLRYRRPGAS